MSRNGHRSNGANKRPPKRRELSKVRSGIAGFDEVTGGGLPRGRPTLVCGSAGCGKTLFGIEFLVRGAVDYDEPGVFMSFEERADELSQNVASLGFDLPALIARKKLVVDQVRVERSEIEETGEYDLEGLFIRIGHAIDTVGAKRIVLDTIESLFAGLSNEAILRAELRRLFGWLKDRGVTAVITGERGDGQLTRQGLEEYVSDCVILLDHRVHDQISTRRLRVVKYRGSMHGTNEYPFVIDEDGMSVLPVTALGLQHDVSEERASSGIARLDVMLDGKGFFVGSSILISGTAGTGKSSIAGHFADATCRAGRRCAMFLFEESPKQYLRNMRSIGIDLGQWERRGRLLFRAARPTLQGLELHLAGLHRVIDQFQPDAVVFDPITNLLQAGTLGEVQMTLLRLVDHLKSRQTTAMFTSLSRDGETEDTNIGISSLMDTWILLRDVEHDGERNRLLYLLKSRGMAHSKQVREFLLTNDGVKLVDVYTGAGGVLAGTARVSQEAKERAEAFGRDQELARTRRRLERKRAALAAKMAAMQAEFDAEAVEIVGSIDEGEATEAALVEQARRMGVLRSSDRVERKSPVRMQERRRKGR